jgi:predicted transcriptional regulator
MYVCNLHNHQLADTEPGNNGAARALSIKTIYADKIRDGSKIFELRTYCPNILPGNWCALYESSPTQHMRTVFQAGETFKLSPDEAWELYEPQFGIDFDSYFTYFRKRKFAYGVHIIDVRSFEPISLFELRDKHNFSVPQGCYFLRDSIHKRIQAEVQDLA